MSVVTTDKKRLADGIGEHLKLHVQSRPTRVSAKQKQIVSFLSFAVAAVSDFEGAKGTLGSNKHSGASLSLRKSLR